VSSPGIERDITLPWHVTACEGEEVEVRLFAPLEGSRKYDGILLGFEGGETDPARPVLINIGEKTVAIPYDAISKMKTLFDFDSL
jgi:ribosome maturation factor RimP